MTTNETHLNELKEKGNELGALLDALMKEEFTDKRAISIAKTEIQTGLLWAIRAINNPDTFI